MNRHRIADSNDQPSSAADRMVEGGALFLLVFTPLAFGTVEPWSEAVAELVILVMVVAWVLGNLGARQLRVRLPAGWLPAALFLCVILGQAMPLPRWLVELLSPRFATMNGEISAYTGEVWNFMPLSMAPYATRTEAVKLLSVAAFFVVVYNVYRARVQAVRAMWTMTLTGTVIALLGLVQRATWTGRLYWVGPEAPHPDPFGPFVNRAHFAGLMILVVPTALALVMPAKAESGRARLLRGWRSRLRAWAVERGGPTRLVPFLILLMGGAALVSGSRGGAVGLIGALLCMITLGAGGRSGRRRVAGIAVLLVLMIATALWISGDILYGTVERLAREVGRPSESFRVRLWADAVPLWMAAPLFGTGLGSFGVAFPAVRNLPAPVAFTHAESDWVQLLTDTGLVGLGLVLATGLSLGLALLGCFRHARSPWARALSLAGLVALVGTAVHGIANFNLPIMSNQLYLVLLLALALRSPDQAESIVHGGDR